MSILEVRQLSKVYGDKQAFQEVLKEINLDVDEGEFISIMGPSGSGKTTLLNVLSSIDYMTKGSNLRSYLISNYLILEKKILDLFFKIIIF